MNWFVFAAWPFNPVGRSASLANGASQPLTRVSLAWLPPNRKAPWGRRGPVPLSKHWSIRRDERWGRLRLGFYGRSLASTLTIISPADKGQMHRLEEDRPTGLWRIHVQWISRGHRHLGRIRWNQINFGAESDAVELTGVDRFQGLLRKYWLVEGYTDIYLNLLTSGTVALQEFINWLIQ